MSASELDGVPAVTRGVHCPPPEALVALGGDALSDEVRAALGRHVSACAACRALVADLEEALGEAWTPEVEERLRARMPLAAIPAHRGFSPWWPWLAAAALVVIAVGLAVSRREAPERVAVQAPPVPTASPRPPAVFAIEVPDLRVPVADVLVMRGAAAVPSPLVSIEAAWRARDFARVAATLAPSASSHPGDRGVAFYLGAARLLAGDPGAAREPLERAARLSAGADADEAQWYLAAAEQRAGAARAAVLRLDALCGHDGPFRERACAAAAESGHATLGR